MRLFPISLLALSVTYGDRLPLLSPAVTSSPERGKSFLKGKASGETGHFAVKPKSLPQCRTFAESGTANAVYLYAPSSENAMPERPQTLRHCSLKNYSSAEYGRSKAEATPDRFPQNFNRIWYHTTPPWVDPETPSFTKPNFA